MMIKELKNFNINNKTISNLITKISKDELINIIYLLKQKIITPKNLEDTSLSPEHFKIFCDAICQTQLRSKLWIVDHLNQMYKNGIKLEKILIVAGWIGFLVILLNKYYIGNSDITLLDINKNLEPIHKNLHNNLKVIYEDALVYDNYNNWDLIINTSCEHLDYQKWLDKININQLLILQCTNLHINEHIFPVISINKFLENCNFNEVLYNGCHDMELSYKRFMIIGRK